MTRVKSELYIHERRQGKQPVPPPRRRQKLKRVASTLSAEAAANAGVIKEMESFVITGK